MLVEFILESKDFRDTSLREILFMGVQDHNEALTAVISAINSRFFNENAYIKKQLTNILEDYRENPITTGEIVEPIVKWYGL